MHFNHFQQGDSVQYVGDKDHLRKELNGVEGFVVGRVGGCQSGVIVAFGEDAYIMDESRHLARFVKKVKPQEEQARGPEVQKRRGVSEGKGKKRRPQDEDSE